MYSHRVTSQTREVLCRCRSNPGPRQECALNHCILNLLPTDIGSLNQVQGVIFLEGRFNSVSCDNELATQILFSAILRLTSVLPCI